jgi:anti-sigma B factor antagonist
MRNDDKIKFFSIIRLDKNCLDLECVPDFSKLLEELCTGECQINRDIVIDLKDIIFISSSGIGLLVHIHQMISKFKCKLYFINTNESVNKILELSKLISFFKVYKDYEEFVNHE